MRKRAKFIAVLIVISNLLPVKLIISFVEQDFRVYSYSNKDNPESIFYEGFKNPFHYRTSVTKDFHKAYPFSDTILYRNFWRNPICFWRWGDYFFDKRYKLPYISREKVVNAKQPTTSPINPNSKN